MADQIINRAWIAEKSEKAGYASQEALARAMGLTGPKLSNALSGKRRLQASEVAALAAALGVPARDVFHAVGQAYSDPYDGIYKICGYIGENDRVEVVAEDSEDFAEAEITIPFMMYSGQVFVIRTASLMPRYRPGELVGAIVFQDNDPEPLTRLVGNEVIAKVGEKDFFLKRLLVGSKPSLFNLTSLNPFVEPMIDVPVKFAARIDFHISSLA